MDIVLELWEMWNTPSLPLISGTLWINCYLLNFTLSGMQDLIYVSAQIVYIIRTLNKFSLIFHEK